MIPPDAPSTLPGTPRHQALLRAVTSYYAGDPRVLAVIVFGSLGRGNWDPFSDLDLDVVIADEVKIDVQAELERLCRAFAPLGEQVALILPDGDEGDVVLESLAQLSVRYHPQAETSPNIVDSMRLLWGRIDLKEVAQAGLANQRAPQFSASRILDAFVRYAAVTLVELQRGRKWLAVEVVHRMRGLLMELFTRTRGGERSIQFFEEKAGAGLQARLGDTFSGCGLQEMRVSLAKLIALAEDEMPELGNGRAGLVDSQLLVLHKVLEELKKG